MYSIGVDIGGSHITSGMYEHTNKLLDKNSLVYKKIDTKGSKDEIINGWICAITKTIEFSGKEIQGIGIAMPGPFNYFEGISLISQVTKLEALYQVNIREEIAGKLEMDPAKVRFINDASAFSIAEAMIGHASKFRKVVAITLGTGLGASFVLNGQPVIQAENVPEGGFLYKKDYKGTMADEIFSTRGILNRYQEICGRTSRNVKELYEKAAQDPCVKEVFSWFGRELGKFLAPYLKEFGAEGLVIGGNISKTNQFFIQDLQVQIPGIEIHISEFGEEAAIIGSALLLEEDFYENLIPTLKLM